MEVVCSQVFSNGDLQAMHSALYECKRQHRTLEQLARLEYRQRGPAMLTWAIANHHLHVRIALVRSREQHGIYHEKIGILELDGQRRLSIEGSANESSSGYVSNFERIVVHQWESARGVHAWGALIERDFERLWQNNTQGLEVISLHEAFTRRLLESRTSSFTSSTNTQTTAPSTHMTASAEILRRPARLRLRPYQEKAVEQWFAQGGRGIYAMATGSGKTVTALATIEELHRRVGDPLVIIIVAPYLNLVDQWLEESKSFGLAPINCTGSSQDWTGVVETALYLNQTSTRPVLSLVTTNVTFAGDAFQRVLAKLRVRTIIVADEVHNLGARRLRACLPEKVQLRLGLSATPERWMDEEGTAAVHKYFGDVTFSYSLKDALRGDPPTLSPYFYHPIMVELEDDEREEYLEITSQLARFMNDPKDEHLSDAVLGLLLKRARLVACARQKLTALRDAIAPYRSTRFNLVYCGDGRVEIESASDRVANNVAESPILRQVEAATRILGVDLEMNVSTYTSDTTREDRQAILRDFEQGDKQALVAIRCLDEGVDIPQVRRAFILASSTNPRQFIQRRGRVLRRAEGKEHADIFDFIVVPPLDALDEGTAEFRVLRKLVSREMERVVEFARLAANGPQAIAKLRLVLAKLRLVHLG